MWRRELGRALAVAVLPVVLVTAAALVVARLLDRPASDLTRDISVVAGVGPSVGALSQLTIGLWVAASAVALFAGSAARDRLLLVLGGLTLVLALDDQYLVHEALLPRLGLPGSALYVGYAAVGLAAVVPERARLLARPDVVVGLLAVALLAGSVAVDVVGELAGAEPEGAVSVVEDALKLAGAATWLLALVGLARHPVTRTPAPGPRR